MRIKCGSCHRKFSNTDNICPHCGAFHTDSRQYTTHASSSPPKKERRGFGAWITLLSVVLGIFTLISSLVKSDSPSVDHSISIYAPSQATTSQASSQSLAVLQKMVDDDPTDFDAITRLLLVQAERGMSSDVKESMALLYRGQCQDSSYFRRAGEAVLEMGDQEYAVRLFLTAYSLSGLQSDLDLATLCGTPAEIMAPGPTTQALEYLFHMPMGKITWEQVGKVRYFALYSNTIDISLTDPDALPSYEFQDTVLTGYPDLRTSKP